MSRKTKTIRRWFVEVYESTYRVLCCPTNKKLAVKTMERDMFGFVKRYYDYDTEPLLSDRQKVIAINKLKRGGYVQET